MKHHVVALCGGVGGAKLAHGLSMALPRDELVVIVNTGDDFRHLGLAISPDLDSVMYALAGLSDPVRGWGRREETWNFMGALTDLGGDEWFRLGDKDLAVHVERTWRLAAGMTLSEVTARLCAALGIAAKVVPMTDDAVRTRVETVEGWLEFQEYFVKKQCGPVIKNIAFAGADSARAQPEALAALNSTDLRAVIICPSNPFVSIEPILGIPEVRSALLQTSAPVIAVTPIIGGRAVKGPAAKMMTELGLDVSAEGVALRYAGLIDGFVVDESDPLPAPIKGMRLFSAPTVMNTANDRLRLALDVLRITDGLIA